MDAGDEPLARLRGAVVVAGGFPLLSGVDLDLERGSLTVLTGPNGAGKTSLLRLLGGMVALSAGEGRVAGVDLARGNRRDLRRRVGWLGHEGSFYDDLTVRENLTFAARALRLPLEGLDEALARVGLTSRSDTPARALSAGQRRRLALAWLLVRRAPLWLLDEPYAALDESARVLFDDVIEAALEGGATVVVSAHQAIGARRAATVLALAGGRVEEGP
jgi:heme ABC exporter ATP-binding subunit CcmA